VVPREQVLLLRYRDLRETPVQTLDTIFDFLGVETGAVTEIPAENVTTHVTDSTRNRVIGAALRRGRGSVTAGSDRPGRRSASGCPGTSSASRTCGDR
jgi:hypothetical protein